MRITASDKPATFVRDPQQQQQDLTTRKLATVDRTINSRDSNNNTSISRDANSNRGAKNSMDDNNS